MANQKSLDKGKGIKEIKFRKMPKYIIKEVTKLNKILDDVAGHNPTGIFNHPTHH